RERGAGVAVAREADAPGVEHEGAVDLEVELYVRMAHAHDVDVDVLHPLGPDTRILQEVLVERVAGRGMDEEEALPSDRAPLGDGQLQQVAPLGRAEGFPHRRPRGAR